MRAASPNADPTEKTVKSGYLFHGAELFPAREFIGRLKGRLVDDAGGPAVEDRFDLEETGWRDIVDTARNVPFFFSPWRLIVVEASKAEGAELTADAEAVLKEFFADPTPRTVLIVIYAGKLAKTKPLYKLFDKLPDAVACVEEMAPPDKAGIVEWIDNKTAALGKRISSDALEQLAETTGGDLRELDTELEKLATYVGDRKQIDAADVLTLTDGEREYKGWDLTDALESGDAARALVILNQQMSEGARGEMMLGTLAGFFRDLLYGRIGLLQGRDRREIFREIRPGIKEFYKYYPEKLRAYFAAVERFSDDEFARMAADLERLDMKIKTTDSDPRALFEALFCEFGRAVRRPAVTSKRRG
jgi:DNA polymerase III subunit delta